jgi:2-oxo-4-hydroxy-4-carboxy-5-ureidoimidazoline decarboxylase
MSVTRPGLPAFNAMERDEARRRLLTCLDVPRWADEVLAGRPYDSVDQVEAAMAAASATITDEELERALARHPRIGERADAARHDAGHSTREQAGVDRDDAEVAAALAAGNRAYEERFDRVFIIRAAGRDAAEVLDHLRRRMDNTDEAERAETIDQLTQIAMLRIREVLS